MGEIAAPDRTGRKGGASQRVYHHLREAIVRLEFAPGTPLDKPVLAQLLGLNGAMPGLTFSSLLPIRPEFDPAVLIGLVLPLYLVTMASQNLPGFAVLRAAGYAPPTQPVLGVTADPEFGGAGMSYLAHVVAIAAHAREIGQIVGRDRHCLRLALQDAAQALAGEFGDLALERPDACLAGIIADEVAKAGSASIRSSTGAATATRWTTSARCTGGRRPTAAP